MAGKRARSKSMVKNARPSKKSRGPSSFPRSKRVPVLDRALYTKSIVVYSDFGRSVDPPLAGVGTYVYSLNGAYDPDITGIGAQPTGFDQYMALYGRYTILKAKVTATCLNGDTTIPQICGVNVSGLPGTSTDPNVYLRNNNYAFRQIDCFKATNSVTTFSLEVDIGQLAGQNIWTDDNFSGTSGTNPGNQWYLFIWNGASDGVSNASACYWTVKIEYLVAFRDAINTANS